MLEMDNGTYECNYYPVSAGQYLVAISWGGHSIPRRSDFISGGGRGEETLGCGLNVFKLKLIN